MFSKRFYTVLNEAYQIKSAYVLLLDVQKFKRLKWQRKTNMFCKGGPRELCMKRHVLNINSYANIIILFNEFVAGLSSFGYDCYKIVGSLLNLEKHSAVQ